MKEKKMKTALIITTYNWPNALELVLKSVLHQSVFPDEVIIADDGSGRETFKLINNIKKNYPIILKHIWQEDRGFRAARIRNKAIAASESDYIIGIDGDMILHKHFIKDHLKVAKRNRYVQGGRVLLNKLKTEEVLRYKQTTFSFFEKGIKNRKNAIHSELLCRIFSKTSKKLKGSKTCNYGIFKEDVIKINGFNNEFIGWGREDTEFLARFLNSGGERFDVKFCAIAYHLYHNENSRKSILENDKKLRDTILNKKTYCEKGIKEFLGENYES